MRLRDEIITALRSAGVHYGMQVRSLDHLAEPAVQLTRAEGGAADTMRWVLTTELPATVWDWDRFDFVKEILVMDGLRTPAVNQVPLLDSHNRNSVDDVLGHVRDFQPGEFSGFKGVDGAVYWADDDKSQRTQAKALGGHITDGSVGYSVDKSIWVPEDQSVDFSGIRYEGPVKLSYQWSLKEFSITPIGADVLAKVRHLRRAMGQ